MKPQDDRRIAFDSRRNYPYNCWWVAAAGTEVTQDLLSRRLLELPVVLYRTADGEVVAMDDRCPHRSLPLSKGKRAGDNVVCGYHGMEFRPDGKCVKVPSQPTPGAMAVRTYPIREIGPFVWIYLGDTAKLNDVPPPPAEVLDWASDGAFCPQLGSMRLDGNYMLLRENVLDLTHFGFVHTATFQVPIIGNAPQVMLQKDAVGYQEIFTSVILPPFLGAPMDLGPEDRADLNSWGTFVSPALHVGGGDILVVDPKPGMRATGNFRICHVTTPIDHRSTHYWWIIGRDHCNDQETMKKRATLSLQAFNEDKIVIEAIQKVYDEDPRSNFIEKSVAADGAGVQARRMIEKWMERETLVGPPPEVRDLGQGATA